MVRRSHRLNQRTDRQSGRLKINFSFGELHKVMDGTQKMIRESQCTKKHAGTF